MRLLECLQKMVFVAPLLTVSFPMLSAAETVATTPKAQTASAGEDVVARVNEVGITALRLKHVMNSLKATQPDATLTPEALKRVERNVLDGLIAKELLYQAGSKLEIKDLDEQVKTKIVRVKAGFADEEGFRKALGSPDLSDKELFNDVRQDIVISNFIAQKINSKLAVSEEEMKRVYDQNLDKLTQEEQARISYIFIKTTPTMTAEEKKKARDKAEDLRKILLQGAPFSELAKRFSDDASKKAGGDTGYFDKKQPEPSLAQAIFALKPGEMSSVVETKTGYHIIKMRDKRPAVTKSYAEVKPQIEEELKEAKSQAAVQQFLEEMRKHAKIEVLVK